MSGGGRTLHEYAVVLLGCSVSYTSLLINVIGPLFDGDVVTTLIVSFSVDSSDEVGCRCGTIAITVEACKRHLFVILMVLDSDRSKIITIFLGISPTDSHPDLSLIIGLHVLGLDVSRLHSSNEEIL